MNHDDNFDEVAVRGWADRARRRGEKAALAATLTRLRNRGSEDCTDFIAGYQEALDAVAKAHGIRPETTVRYVA